MRSGWHCWKIRRGPSLVTLLAVVLAVSAAVWWSTRPHTARELYEARCAACHALPDLSGYNAEQRAAIVATMRRSNGAAGVIDEREATEITGYLLEELKQQ